MLQIIRPASTGSDPATNVTTSQEPPVAQLPTSDQQFGPLLDDLASADYPQVAHHIGFLKELGLDYGWGPTALVQTLFEYVHIYIGTPWWGTCIVTALLVRLAFFKVYVNASDSSVRLMITTPHIKPIRDRLNLAQRTKDVDAVRHATAELAQIYKSADIKLYKVFLPFLQAPLGYGSFRLLRGMAALPVPGLEDGGLLWFEDLTLPDPYYVLPLAFASTLFWTFKVSIAMLING